MQLRNKEQNKNYDFKRTEKTLFLYTEKKYEYVKIRTIKTKLIKINRFYFAIQLKIKIKQKMVHLLCLFIVIRSTMIKTAAATTTKIKIVINK